MSKSFHARLLMPILCLHLTGCDRKDWEAAGYQDGYAATINKACAFRATMIHGKWEDSDYSRGYARGSSDGATSVAREGCDKLK